MDSYDDLPDGAKKIFNDGDAMVAGAAAIQGFLRAMGKHAGSQMESYSMTELLEIHLKMAADLAVEMRAKGNPEGAEKLMDLVVSSAQSNQRQLEELGPMHDNIDSLTSVGGYAAVTALIKVLQENESVGEDVVSSLAKMLLAELHSDITKFAQDGHRWAEDRHRQALKLVWADLEPMMRDLIEKEKNDD